MKNIILPLLVVLGALGLIVFFGSPTKEKTPSTPSTPSTPLTPYSDTAKVMYFYSETCGWCQKQKTILDELAKEDYKVKPMDVGKNQEYWRTYNISGTPAFIAPDGQKLVGYTEKEKLKEFLEKYR